jgi:glycosyltransferase involved in cell wall biosynthesis
LKIGVNALLYSAGQDYRQTGISRYIDRLLGHLGAQCGPFDITAFVGKGAQPSWDRVHLNRIPISGTDPRARIPAELTLLPIAARRSDLDLFHGPVNTLPPLIGRARQVVTIHDLAFLRFPDQITRRRSIYLNAMIQRAVRRADHILVPSQATALDLVGLLNADRSPITVTPLGAEPHFRPLTTEHCAAAKARFGLDRPFVLTVGTIEPRKNLPRLIDAFVSIADAVPHDLVLVGPTGWLTDSIEHQIASSALGGRIKRTGFVDDAGLVGLYNAADVVAIPSLYEGFGLPVLEAMACGAVVLTSDCSSLPEVTGDAALLVDPRDINAIAAGLLRALNDTALRRELEAAALTRAAAFSWDRTARLTAGAYRAVLA